MAQIGVTITKSVAFRDSVQEFNNTYFYNNGALGALPSESDAEAIIDALVAKEKTFHGTGVTFKYARLWSQTEFQASSNMIYQKALTGTGEVTGSVTVDRERAFLFRRRAGNDSRGQPVYLRKYYHSCSEFGAGFSHITSAVLQNTTGFTTVQRTAQRDKMQSISEHTGNQGPWTIAAKGSREPTEPLWEAHRYLEHHQLGDQWRGA